MSTDLFGISTSTDAIIGAVLGLILLIFLVVNAIYWASIVSEINANQLPTLSSTNPSAISKGTAQVLMVVSIVFAVIVFLYMVYNIARWYYSSTVRNTVARVAAAAAVTAAATVQKAKEVIVDTKKGIIAAVAPAPRELTVTTCEPDENTCAKCKVIEINGENVCVPRTEVPLIAPIPVVVEEGPAPAVLAPVPLVRELSPTGEAAALRTRATLSAPVVGRSTIITPTTEVLRSETGKPKTVTFAERPSYAPAEPGTLGRISPSGTEVVIPARASLLPASAVEETQFQRIPVISSPEGKLRPSEGGPTFSPSELRAIRDLGVRSQVSGTVPMPTGTELRSVVANAPPVPESLVSPLAVPAPLAPRSEVSPLPGAPAPISTRLVSVPSPAGSVTTEGIPRLTTPPDIPLPQRNPAATLSERVAIPITQAPLGPSSKSLVASLTRPVQNTPQGNPVNSAVSTAEPGTFVRYSPLGTETVVQQRTMPSVATATTRPATFIKTSGFGGPQAMPRTYSMVSTTGQPAVLAM